MRKNPSFSTPAQMATDVVENKILSIRNRRVMLDVDLAEVYQVTTKRLNEQVKRNRRRFPEDFMFQLSADEARKLMRSQIATASKRNIRYRPYAFTEHGAVMLASSLNSNVAVEASIQVVRAFVRIRTILAAHKELAGKLDALEKKYDSQFKVVFEAIRQLMNPRLPSPKRPIGFVIEPEKK